ncbi:hypothetical protein [Crossiella sp. NPDC003009]
MTKPLDPEDKIVEAELTQFWIQRGERLLLGCPPVRGYVCAWLAGQTRLPHEPISAMPELDLGRHRWPLPAKITATSPAPAEDWAEDPTVGYWAAATDPAADAIRLADHLAHSRGEARLVLTDQRVAIVYPTKLFQPKNPATVFTTGLELPAGRIAGVRAPFVGRGVPMPRVLEITFAEGSVLQLRLPQAAARVQRALARGAA